MIVFSDIAPEPTFEELTPSPTSTFGPVSPNPPSFSADTWTALALAAAIIVAGVLIAYLVARHRRK